jgi:hypothetical protein
MQHHTEPNAGTNICGAGSEVAKLWVEGEWDTGFDVIIQLIAGVPAFIESQTAVQHLNAEWSSSLIMTL